MNELRTVVSLFDGYGGALIVLKSLGIKFNKFYSSEIDSNANKVNRINNPEIIEVGDVTNWKEWDVDWSKVDLVIAGSPCQGFSDSGNGENFEDPRSKLFFEFVDIRNHVLSKNPSAIWFLENVKMKKAWRDKISEYVGVNPLRIDARLVSVCGRDRNYWFNWEADKPEDKGLMVFDFVEDEFKYPAAIVGRRINKITGKRDDYNKEIPIVQYLYSLDGGKARCVTTVSKDCLLTNKEPGMYEGAYLNYKEGIDYRKPTIKELCQWHGIPEGYFDSITESQARSMIGNGWNIDVVKVIFEQLPNLDRKEDMMNTHLPSLALGQKANHQQINQDSGDVEFYTPPFIIESARKVMGGIDLDPASNEIANKTVRAEKIFTKEDNGLAQEWAGRVWMNHPFGKGELPCKKNRHGVYTCKKKACVKRGYHIDHEVPGNIDWIAKYINSYEVGRVTDAINICFANTSEDWFTPLLEYPQCWIKGRINYYKADGRQMAGAPKGSVITYLGNDYLAFKREFSQYGKVK